MDCSFVQVYTEETHACWCPTAKVMIPMDLVRKQVHTLVDSGCGQTLVCQGLALASDLARFGSSVPMGM